MNDDKTDNKKELKKKDNKVAAMNLFGVTDEEYERIDKLLTEDEQETNYSKITKHIAQVKNEIDFKITKHKNDIYKKLHEFENKMIDALDTNDFLLQANMWRFLLLQILTMGLIIAVAIYLK